MVVNKITSTRLNAHVEQMEETYQSSKTILRVYLFYLFHFYWKQHIVAQCVYGKKRCWGEYLSCREKNVQAMGILILAVSSFWERVCVRAPCACVWWYVWGLGHQIKPHEFGNTNSTDRVESLYPLEKGKDMTSFLLSPRTLLVSVSVSQIKLSMSTDIKWCGGINTFHCLRHCYRLVAQKWREISLLETRGYLSGCTISKDVTSQV